MLYVLAAQAHNRTQVFSCTFSDDSAWLISGSADAVINVYHTRTRKKVATVLGHESPVIAVTWSQNRLVSSCGDQGAHVFHFTPTVTTITV
jgi:WD40 repeat protein